MKRARTRIFKASESEPEVKIHGKVGAGAGAEPLVSFRTSESAFGEGLIISVDRAELEAAAKVETKTEGSKAERRKCIECGRLVFVFDTSSRHRKGCPHRMPIRMDKGGLSAALDLLAKLLPYAGESYDSMTNAQAKDCLRTAERVSAFLGR